MTRLFSLWLSLVALQGVVDGFQSTFQTRKAQLLSQRPRIPSATQFSNLPRSNCFRYRQPQASIQATLAISDEFPDDDDSSASFENKNEKSSRRKKIFATTFNLVKAIAGSGILALPGGLAAMSDYKSSLIPAVALMVGLGALSAYTFGLYGKLLSVHEANSLGELWEKEKGGSSSWVISLASLTFCFGAALSYVMLLGDTFPALSSTAGLGGIFLSRSFWIMFTASTVLYPLSNLQSLLALAPLSMAGVAAVAATTCFLGFRCPSINPASPYVQGSGAFVAGLASTLRPQFGTYNKGIASPSASILVGMAASAYLGHFSAPSFYASLRSKDTKKDQADFQTVTGAGFGIATLLNCLVMVFGYLTFGGGSSGVVLNNFSTLDPGASICRLLMAVCVIGGFPFLTRSVVTEYLKLRGQGTDRPQEKRTTLQALGLLTAAALVVKDAGFVIGFCGAVMGSFIVYIFPALLFLSQSGKNPTMTWKVKTERIVCRGLVALGALVAALGGGVSVANSYFPHLLS